MVEQFVQNLPQKKLNVLQSMVDGLIGVPILNVRKLMIVAGTSPGQELVPIQSHNMEELYVGVKHLRPQNVHL